MAMATNAIPLSSALIEPLPLMKVSETKAPHPRNNPIRLIAETSAMNPPLVKRAKL